MDRILLIGDRDTASAFRLGGIDCIVSDREHVAAHLGAAMSRGDAAVLLITSSLAAVVSEAIRDCNLTRARPVVVEIPGVFDDPSLSRSIMSYVTEALGISI
ncbi:MAG: V-type ATP synthase subunit F [Spirochaetes bacterium]|nr:V-type ATP synthase subunit F [Spirochaetota bacterium]